MTPAIAIRPSRRTRMSGRLVAATLLLLSGLLRAVFSTPDYSITSTTVVGTYSVTGTGNPRELPILRVVLSAQNAAKVDWDHVTPQDLISIADVYRVNPPIGDEQARPIAPATPV